MNYMMIDFDGPLLPMKFQFYEEYRTYRGEGGLIAQFDNYCVDVHNRIRKWGNAQIVFSTNWSYHKSIEDLKSICEHNCLEFEGNYYEDPEEDEERRKYTTMTPKRFSSSNRASEILDWMENHAKEGDKILAIDDDPYCKDIENYYQYRIENSVDCYNWGNMDNPPVVKWIEVDSEHGMSHKNLMDSLEFFDVDMDEYGFKEYNIPILTPEEKQKREEAREMLFRAMI